MTRPHTFGPAETKMADRIDKLTRLGCACGAPSGAQGGVTLRSVIVTKAKVYEKILLCPGCLQEFEQFGHMLSFGEWGRYFLEEIKRSLWFVLSFRRHAGQTWVQWKFRHNHEPVRALAADNQLRSRWTDAVGILTGILIVVFTLAIGWTGGQLIVWLTKVVR
jgi:hypothetical protein